MYKLILMDCNMPIMDGFSATKHIRTKVANFNKAAKHIKLVQPLIAALTAYNTE
jgi:CheY-like chemotaxis protein